MVFTVDPLAPDWTISWRLLSGKEVWRPTGMHTYKHTQQYFIIIIIIIIINCKDWQHFKIDVFKRKVGDGTISPLRLKSS